MAETRKTVNRQQRGIAVEQAVSPATTLRVTGCAGRRQIEQYPAFPGSGATSSGGVVDLTR